MLILKMLGYGLIMFALGYIAKTGANHFKASSLANKIEVLRKDDEEVATYNATVLINQNGEATWFDNDDVTTFIDD